VASMVSLENINIWALQKDVTIKHLLLLLNQNFGKDVFNIHIEHENEKAIRFSKADDNTLSVYVFTYGQETERYGVHLEYPDLKETSVNNTLDVYDNVNYQMLCELVQSHLDINPIVTLNI
jgi:hypothetical protein